jgi:peptidoglycan hydrolase-like protein with peptidoglycan-binding domain
MRRTLPPDPPARGIRDTWFVRSRLDNVTIEVCQGHAEREIIEQSRSELSTLLALFECGDPDLERVLLEVVATVSGTSRMNSRDAFMLDERSSLDTRAMMGEVRRRLERAAACGLITLRRERLPRSPPALPKAPPVVVAPPRRPQPPDVFYQYRVRVVDDTGTAVTGVRLKLDIDGTPRMTSTDGSGSTIVDWVTSTPASLVMLDLKSIWARVKPRWTKAPATKPPPGDQIVTFTYEHEPDSLTIPCGPLVVIVLARPPVRRVRLVGMLFDADKCFLLPQALPGIRDIVAMHGRHSGAKMLVVGHSGSDEVCQGTDVALARARSLAAYLTSVPDVWLKWFDPGVPRRQRWATREVQLMLSALSGDRGPFFAGYASGVTDRETSRGIRAFQAHCNATSGTSLAVDGKAGPATREALVKAYMAIEGTTISDAQPTAHGCDGHTDDTLTDDGLQPDDRRAEVFFFDYGVDPAPEGDVSAAGAADYPAWRKRVIETVDFENHGIHVQILDTKNQPVPFADVQIAGPTTQSARADANGFVSFSNLGAGDYTVQAARKGYIVGSSTLTYPTAKTLPGTLGKKDVSRVRMVGMLFDADKCFLLPQAIDGVRMVTAMQRDHASAEIVVVGHASGDEEYKGPDLALARARSLVALVGQDPAPWLAWFGSSVPVRQRWGTRELQLMLSALPDGGTPFFGGYPSGITDADTLGAVRAFQKSAGLAVDGKPGPLTRAALVKQYMSLHDVALPAGLRMVAHACDAQTDDTLAEDGLEPDDRRLEVLFFDNGIRPPPDGDTSGPDADDYKEWLSRLGETKDYQQHGVHVQVIDTLNRPMPFARVHIEGPSAADDVADAHGFVTFFGLSSGLYTVRAEIDGGSPVTSTLQYPTGKTQQGLSGAR